MKLYPTHKNALNITHPTHGKLKADGGDWPEDSFTARMLSDKIVSTDEKDLFKPDKEPAAKPTPSGGLPDEAHISQK